MLGNSIQLIGKEKNYYMEQYKVKGMSCAACSARVEKAVSAVDGVTDCTVSLLTNSMSERNGRCSDDYPGGRESRL